MHQLLRQSVTEVYIYGLCTILRVKRISSLSSINLSTLSGNYMSQVSYQSVTLYCLFVSFVWFSL
jgi:hypothetical protein